MAFGYRRGVEENREVLAVLRTPNTSSYFLQVTVIPNESWLSDASNKIKKPDRYDLPVRLPLTYQCQAERISSKLYAWHYYLTSLSIVRQPANSLSCI
jgi:hypothetical protein